jgi:hypothetical protein
MNTTDNNTDAAPAAPAIKRDRGAAATAVTHAEPQRGGSYTRNLETGALVSAQPDPDQPAE